MSKFFTLLLEQPITNFAKIRRKGLRNGRDTNLQIIVFFMPLLLRTNDTRLVFSICVFNIAAALYLGYDKIEDEESPSKTSK